MIIEKACRWALILLEALALGCCVAASASAQTAPGIDVLSSGRLGALFGALAGLTGVVVGGLALARSRRRAGTGRRSHPRVAIAAGLLAAAVGTLVIARSTGGVGTGNGVGGAVVAVVLGLLGAALGVLARARARRE